ncbi:MAG TPA: PhaM family polyhydroxyalkanoate granule multifunctional regulatory protein [Noviherbaspirillum sp.]
MADSSMSGIPGVGAMTDTLEFVKNLWGGMKIPGMAMPSLSVDDVNKQIADLKAVESWLNVNMSMLRSTIQALEVQSATLAALQTMSNSMNSLAQAGMPQPASADSKPAADMAKAFSFAPPQAEKPPTPAAGDKPAGEPPQANADMGNATAFANPAAWWNLLQDQFKQAVSTAVTTEPRAEPRSEPKAAEAEKAKPRARKTVAKKRAPKA